MRTCSRVGIRNNTDPSSSFFCARCTIMMRNTARSSRSRKLGKQARVPADCEMGHALHDARDFSQLAERVYRRRSLQRARISFQVCPCRDCRCRSHHPAATGTPLLSSDTVKTSAAAYQYSHPARQRYCSVLPVCAWPPRLHPSGKWTASKKL